MQNKPTKIKWTPQVAARLARRCSRRMQTEGHFLNSCVTMPQGIYHWTFLLLKMASRFLILFVIK